MEETIPSYILKLNIEPSKLHMFGLSNINNNNSDYIYNIICEKIANDICDTFNKDYNDELVTKKLFVVRKNKDIINLIREREKAFAIIGDINEYDTEEHFEEIIYIWRLYSACN